MKPQPLSVQAIVKVQVDLWSWPVAKLVEIHDGDTIRLDVDQGFDERARKWIRLARVRCPDPGTPDFTQEDYDRARQDTMDWFATYAPDGYVSLATEKVKKALEIRFRESFTRYIGHVRSLKSPTEELNDWLLKKGWTDRGL
jgi:hypothetical protein